MPETENVELHQSCNINQNENKSTYADVFFSIYFLYQQKKKNSVQQVPNLERSRRSDLDINKRERTQERSEEYGLL